jgi:hypothetical protein
MVRSDNPSGWSMLILQVFAVLMVTMLIALAPPANGDMLLVPLMPQRTAAVVAVEQGALIVAKGRFGQTLVVRGRFGAIAWPLLREGTLTIGAPAVLCGGTPTA